MTSPLGRVLFGLCVLGVGAVLLVRGPFARAEDAPPARSAGTWFYDVRVVRVDAAAAATLEVAPAWRTAEAEPERGVTTTAWPDLLAGLKARGGTSILLDQRVTTRAGVAADFAQKRRRLVQQFQNRTKDQEVWTSFSVDTGVNGQLVPQPEELQYKIEVNWEEGLKGDGQGPLGSVTWRGAIAGLATGTTLVLWHRQQALPETSAQHGTEIYVFVTGRLVRGG